MTLSEAVTIARKFLAEDNKLVQSSEVLQAYNVLAKYHGRMDEMEKFAETYLKKETV